MTIPDVGGIISVILALPSIFKYGIAFGAGFLISKIL